MSAATPGDLSARHEVLGRLQRLTDAAEADWKAGKAVVINEPVMFLLRQTIAALSALPAAGGAESSPEDRFEFFVQQAIAKSPDPLRELGEYLGEVLDEDKFPRADALLLQLATSFTPQPSAAEKCGTCGDTIKPDALTGTTCKCATHGDLSARLREVLSFYANKANYDSPESNCGNYYLASEADKDKGEKAREAIAALSALPAAGGEVAEWRWVDERGRAMTSWKQGDPPPMTAVSDTKGTMSVEVRTTPQPSAAEGKES